MKRATLTALEKSIKKWEAIVDGTGVDHGSLNCALCLRFTNGCETTEGELCPVHIDSGELNCFNTPWQDWCEALTEKHFLRLRKAADDETVMCAVLELEFLKSLLPSRKRKPK